VVRAAPAPADDLVKFDIGFREGQEQFNRGEYLTAARTWSVAVERLRESPDNKDNRAAVYSYIADAYRKSVNNGAGIDIVREGLAALDAYAAQFDAAYPGEALPTQVIETRDQFRAASEAYDAAAKPQEREPSGPPPGPSAPVDAPPPAKPWRPLAIGGGVSLGLGLASLGVVLGGIARSREAQREYNDAANACPSDPKQATGICAESNADGKAGNAMQVVGLVLAPALLGAGAALLAIGLKRRAAAGRVAVAPTFGPRSAGLTWVLRF
jgi:tetratricopeptide (TPR) repeat protein